MYTKKMICAALLCCASVWAASPAKAVQLLLPTIPDNASDGIWLGVGEPTFLLEADEANNNTLTITWTGIAFAVQLVDAGASKPSISDLIVADDQSETLSLTSFGPASSAEEKKAALAKVKIAKVSLPESGDWQNLSVDAGQPLWVFSRVDAVPLPATLPLFASGLAGLGWLSRRRRKQLQIT